eukprot:gene10211-11897_t
MYYISVYYRGPFVEILTWSSTIDRQLNDTSGEFFIRVRNRDINLRTVVVNKKRDKVIIKTIAWEDANQDLLFVPPEKIVRVNLTLIDGANNTLTRMLGGSYYVDHGHYCLHVQLRERELVIEPSENRMDYVPGNGVNYRCFNTKDLVKPGTSFISGVGTSTGVVVIYVPTIRGDTYHIGQFAWHDVNGNGQRDTDETPLADVTVVIRTRDGLEADRVLTGPDGFFKTRALPPGDYTVQCLSPSQTMQIQFQRNYTGKWHIGDLIENTVRANDGMANITLPNDNTIRYDEYRPGERGLAPFIDPSIGCGFGGLLVAIGGRANDEFLNALPNSFVLLEEMDTGIIQIRTTDDEGYFLFDRLAYNQEFCISLHKSFKECFNSNGQGLLDVRLTTPEDNVDATIIIFRFNVPRTDPATWPKPNYYQGLHLEQLKLHHLLLPLEHNNHNNYPVNALLSVQKTKNGDYPEPPRMPTYPPATVRPQPPPPPPPPRPIIPLSNSPPQYTINGELWTDNNNNGQRDSLDTPIHTKVTLIPFYPEGPEQIIYSTQYGLFEFTDLQPGRYFVSLDLGQLSHPMARVSPSAVYQEHTDCIILVIVKDSNVDLDAYVKAPVVAKTVIKGVVWEDLNQNLKYDMSEPRVAVKYSISDDNEKTVDSGFSEDGNFESKPLDHGSYCLSIQLQQPNYVLQSLAGKALEAYIDGGIGDFICFNTRKLSKATPEKQIGLDYVNSTVSIFAPTRKEVSYRIGHLAWLDSNSNGIRDGNEQPLKGVTLEVYNLDGRCIDRSVSDENGRFLSRVLPTGDRLEKTMTHSKGVGHVSLPGHHSIPMAEYDPKLVATSTFISPSIECGFGPLMVAISGVDKAVPPFSTIYLKELYSLGFKETKTNAQGEYRFDLLKYGTEYCLVDGKCNECFNSDGLGLLNVRRSVPEDNIEASILIYHFDLPRPLSTSTPKKS